MRWIIDYGDPAPVPEGPDAQPVWNGLKRSEFERRIETDAAFLDLDRY